MKIKDEHLYHGAALNQIAEHRKFTAINALKVKVKTSRSAFRINDATAVYLKYATSPMKPFSEYQFTFTRSHRTELKAIFESGEDLYLALVCVKAKQICCMTYKEFVVLHKSRRKAAGHSEDQFVILVTLNVGEAFRAYVNSPGTKGKYIKPKMKIARNNFPKILLK